MADEWNQYLDLQEQETVTFGPNTEKLLESVTRNFADFTILLVFYNEKSRSFRPAEIAGLVNESKQVVREVVNHLIDNEILRENGRLTKSYTYLGKNKWDATIYNLIKLWKHPKTHDVVLRKLLAGQK